MLLVTGGAGFIGSNFILRWLEHANESIVNLDALTYAGNLENLRPLEHDPRYRFVRGNVCDAALVADLFERFRPRAVVHFAAESHVDRSITGPSVFVETNVTGTTTLLNTAYRYWLGLPDEEKANFRFLNVSTDEVYGSMDREPARQRIDPLRSEQSLFREQSGGRPIRARLCAHLRASRSDGALHEQLRPAPVSGKAHAEHHHPRRCGASAPNLRIGPTDPRLDPRG